jgi:hypothetical protein
MLHGPQYLDPFAACASIILAIPVISLVTTAGSLISLRSATVARARQMLILGLFLIAAVPSGVVVAILSNNVLPYKTKMILHQLVRHALDASRAETVALLFASLVLFNALVLVLGNALFRRDRVAVL